MNKYNLERTAKKLIDNAIVKEIMNLDLAVRLIEAVQEKAEEMGMRVVIAVSDASGHTGNLLAKSVSSDASGKVWTVKLRDDLKWSDGEALTVDDVLFTANLICAKLMKLNLLSKMALLK